VFDSKGWNSSERETGRDPRCSSCRLVARDARRELGAASGADGAAPDRRHMPLLTESVTGPDPGADFGRSVCWPARG